MPSQPTTSRRERAGGLLADRRLLLVLPALVALAVFANSLGNGFVLDDEWIVEKNTLIRSLGNLPAIFASDWWAARGLSGGLYRPLTVATFALDHALGGLRPLGYHAVNVLLHAAASTMVLALTWRLTRMRAAGVAAGVLFAVHPIHVEAVANIVGRAELLAACGVLGALLSHLRAVDAGARRARPWHALSMGLFGLALLSKENAVTFVVLPALHDACFRRARGGGLAAVRERWTVHAAFAAVAAGYLVARGAVLGRLTVPGIPDQDNLLADLSLLERLPSALALVGRYAALLAWPSPLSYDYGPGALAPSTLADPWVLAGLAVLGGLLALFVRSWRAGTRDDARAAVAFLVAFSAVTYSIVSNLFVPIGTIMGERLLYLPSVGLAGLAGIGLAALPSRLPGPAAARRWAGPGLTVLLALPLAARSIDRNRDWRSNRDLFLADASGPPLSAKIQFNAGLMRFEDAEWERAAALFERSIEAHPAAKPMFFLGRANGALGREEERARIYRETGERFPESFHGALALGWLATRDDRWEDARVQFEHAVRRDPGDDAGRFNLAVALTNLRDWSGVVRVLASNPVTKPGLAADAARLLSEARQQLGSGSAVEALSEGRPSRLDAAGLVRLGEQLVGEGRNEEASRAFEEALKLEPGSAAALRGSGLASYNLGRLQEAVDTLELVRLDQAPASEPVYVALGAAYRRLERPEPAADVLAEGLSHHPDSVRLLEALAYLEYATLRRYPEAAGHFRRLLELDPENTRREEYGRALAWLEARGH